MKKEVRIKRKNYFIIDNDYVKHYAKHLGVMATAVYTSLCMHLNYETKTCFPSMVTIAEQHGIDRHTVSRALKKLEEWNIIQTKRGIKRNMKRRKNNIYTVLPKELWKKIPEEKRAEEKEGTPKVSMPLSHGNNNALSMASKIPYDGTESSSNNTHITRIIEEDSLCRQKPTKKDLSNKLNTSEKNHKDDSLVKTIKPKVWNNKKAISELIESGYKDYIIIGNYFRFKKYIFNNDVEFNKEFKRQLKPANLLKEYKTSEIMRAMEMCERDYGNDLGWSLEAVSRNIILEEDYEEYCKYETLK